VQQAFNREEPVANIRIVRELLPDARIRSSRMSQMRPDHLPVRKRPAPVILVRNRPSRDQQGDRTSVDASAPVRRSAPRLRLAFLVGRAIFDQGSALSTATVSSGSGRIV
jgi:hypothetical protein